ncbi:hypothetical protein PLESTB_001380600 [Pleodorina starrii]|uniref:Uncharacterized protein n=1 Tax=Pleodorina starrii TaxID=330485 RepID=A0A9W6BVA4_9CHLO|nr:hypothetical protein PLESTM_000404600 [Pleodorina starrii]GLC58615.1 hypothetical protein PLESTB_001380600 [Pleodorina starrii]GLC67478.1 hypothetical protein PLESTF_000561800 [Pleodorina starrii]
MALSLRTNAGLRAARTSRRAVAARANLASEVPPNVREAREWIAAWKTRQAPAAVPAVPTPTAPVVPPNVLEARDWIAAWKARQAPDAVPAVPTTAAPVVPPNVLEAREWIAAWKARQAPSTPQDCKEAAVDVNVETVEIATRTDNPGPVIAIDGTLTFTKDVLDSSTYEDLLKALVAKETRQ